MVIENIFSTFGNLKIPHSNMSSANVEQEGPPQREQGDSKIPATPAKQRWTDIAFPARQSDHTVRKRPERREYKIEESLGLGNAGLGKQHDLRPRAIAVAFNSLDEAVRVPIDAVGALPVTSSARSHGQIISCHRATVVSSSRLHGFVDDGQRPPKLAGDLRRMAGTCRGY
jgi:hypothetical protein